MTKYKRSSFLITYWNEDDNIVLYNYNRYTKAVVSKEVKKILDMLSKWRNVHQISEELGIDENSLTKALEHLSKLKMVQKNSSVDEDDRINVGVPWEPIDLASIRQRSYGGRRPMEERVGKSPSPIKRIKGISSIILPTPQNIGQKTDTLLQILGERKSIRKYAKNRLSLDDLSLFLYHSARIKEIYKSVEGVLTKRPYPSGGSRYPLEIYISNNRIKDIQKGIYQYDPLKHRLILMSQNNTYQKKFNSFIKDIQNPSMIRVPDILLIITAVFARTLWKYENVGLSLILSDLGCLYQTMYLMATEMNLAPCAIGKTDEELVKKWLNLKWFEESHVGTFMLGVPENGPK
jgi:SagB-type dehydrogenase family enzyme